MTSAEDRKISGHTMRGLADVQDGLGDGVDSAIAQVQFAGSQMEKTHGLICAVTNDAVKSAEAERSTAGGNLKAVCTELAQKLRHGASAFDGTDRDEKDKLDRQMPPR
ncbi:ESX-1 secretion-associated protein [Mycolicibacterium conceptionense]|uniref:ESX-1 secretion-associated protein n=1 Tax=Mycolicibacterium conceptionense TaxID=451644 RepID=UPI0009D700D8|nr:ESX-1 secretion-associated protein [Mycolicibacterium conceptionense]